MSETTHVLRATPEEIMRTALLELSHWLPSAKGMDPASRASLFRAELERRRERAKRALEEALLAAYSTGEEVR